MNPTCVIGTWLMGFVCAGAMGCSDAPRTDPSKPKSVDRSDIAIRSDAAGTTIQFKGVRYRFTGQTRNQNIRNDEVSLQDASGRVWKFGNGNVLRNEQPLGQVHPGDRVEIDTDGSVTINGRPTPSQVAP